VSDKNTRFAEVALRGSRHISPREAGLNPPFWSVKIGDGRRVSKNLPAPPQGGGCPPALSPDGASVVTGQTSRILSNNQDVQIPIRNRVPGRGDGMSFKRPYHGHPSKRQVAKDP